MSVCIGVRYGLICGSMCFREGCERVWVWVCGYWSGLWAALRVCVHCSELRASRLVCVYWIVLWMDIWLCVYWSGFGVGL